MSACVKRQNGMVENAVPTNTHKIIHGPSTKVLNAGHIYDETTMLKVFLTEELVDKMVDYTHMDVRRRMAASGKTISDWKPTDASELWELFGVFSTRGRLKQGQIGINIILSKLYGIPIMSSTINLNRFKDFLCNLGFFQSPVSWQKYAYTAQS